MFLTLAAATAQNTKKEKETLLYLHVSIVTRVHIKNMVGLLER
jgi:hypothetical protein